MKPSKKVKSPLAKFLQQQLEAKKAGNRYGVLGKDISNQFTAGEYSQPDPKTGGRNGNGKP